MQTVVLTGGGSGGHITPILAVATELKALNPKVHVVYVGQKGDPLATVPESHPAIDDCRLISAGKLRRYHGEGMKQLLHAPTVAKNVQDVFKVVRGAGQAYRLLGKLRANVVYTPGGYVGVPVGVAAARRHIPLLTHDLDALPGLANRINARWATLHITALPAEAYPYPAEKVIYAGVPVAKEFEKVTSKTQQEYKASIGIPTDALVLLVIGGGQGAQRINDAVHQAISRLLTAIPKLHVLHVAGAKNEPAMNRAYDRTLDKELRSRVRVFGFVSNVYALSAAADLIITRAGATNMAEFANQHRACMVIPSPVLTGGHQVKNVEQLHKATAIELMTEDELRLPGTLEQRVIGLFKDPHRLTELREGLGAFARPHAARTVAETILMVMAKPAKLRRKSE